MNRQTTNNTPTDPEPPDFDQCEAQVKVAGESEFERCLNEPSWFLVPKDPRDRSRMTLCLRCAEVLMSNPAAKRSIDFQPILPCVYDVQH